ncbi:hypothetical protein SDC9_27473 [bioreactor metagenome]|uniref:Acyltransferase 3 domain-containing protein n=1 Tax=bioreactor metagenome TaxID=1076179 RepID=A0A644US52_9ZZZZ
MAKQRILSIEYIRGISMLGVVGIHTGAFSLSNPNVNIHLFALLEIFTRFSVPIFFFVSAFGLFISQNLNEPFNYVNFIKRRLRTVLIPYVSWSLIYMLHYTWISGDTSLWHQPLLSEYFLFGLASYQLYFLVILLWFYALMPVWRFITVQIINNPVRNLSILLCLQIVFNYYSSYILHPLSTNFYLNLILQYRLSYWVAHYVFIFVLGAVCAIKYEEFLAFTRRRLGAINVFFYLSLIGMLLFYYYLLFIRNYTPEAAVNTAHQLSPIGVLYTYAATLFWFSLFSHKRFSSHITLILQRLGDNSYMVYLVHPFVMYYLINYLTNHAIIMTVPVVISFFTLTVLISLCIAFIEKRLSKYIPLLSTLLLGSKISRL